MNIKKFIKNRETLNTLVSLFRFIPDKQYLQIMYRLRMGKKLNLDNPVTFNEKIQWLKLYDRKPIYTTMVDKYEAKKYVADIIGEEYIIPTLGIWDKFDDINFDLLPNQFVLKCTHDSGGLVIVKDKSQMDKAAARKKIEKSLKTNFFWVGREWPYKNVKPRIIAEKYMEDSNDDLRDYKYFVFNGIAKALFVASDRNNPKRTEKKSSLEKEIIRNVHYIGGRTTWDKVSALAINPSAEYIYAPEMIRNEFYDSQRWDINQIARHRIFMHQGFKPIKGLHILIEALAVLRKKYPDAELYMSGSNYMKNETFKDRLLQPGYIKYLFKKIKEYNVEDCIHFTGVLDGGQIVDELKRAHVMVLPSAIENSPNSLCEAQLVGIPCVASYVGGVPEMIEQGKTGFLYTFNEPLLLAEFISQIFESDDLAEQMSSNEYNSIRKRQGKELVLKQTVDNYNFVINDFKKNR